MDDRLSETFERLKTLRDELRLQVHLGKAEFREEFEDLEDTWQDVERRLEEVRDEAMETAEEAQKAAQVIAEELSAAYARIKERLD